VWILLGIPLRGRLTSSLPMHWSSVPSVPLRTSVQLIYTLAMPLWDPYNSASQTVPALASVGPFELCLAPSSMHCIW
jgi:hypothetical protein